MEPLAENFNQIFKDLLELGFNKNFIDKALQLTNDKEKAVELILKFQEEEEECEIAKALQFSKNESLSHTNQNLIPIVTTNINSNSPNAQNISQNQLIDKEKENEEDWYFQKNDYKLVILVRTDLKMGVGKIAAQVGHAVLGAYKNVFIEKKPKNLEDLEMWEDYGNAKVVLKVNSKEEMLDMEQKAKLLGLNTCVIHDAGRTQIEAGSMTVCAIGPAEKSVIDSVTKHLKLL